MSNLTFIQTNIEVLLIILCLAIFVITMLAERANKQSYKYIWIIDAIAVGLLISNILAVHFRGDTSTLGFYMVRIANFFDFAFLYSTVLYVSFFVDRLLERPKKGRKRIILAKFASGMAIAITVMNLFIPILYDFDDENRYFRLNGWYINAVWLLIAIIAMVISIIEHKDDIDPAVYHMLLLDILMPVIATVAQIFIYGIAILDIAVGVTQILLFLILYIEQVKRIKERDMQVEEYNAKLMLTQVQPHFMLNTLSTIQYLCKTDSDAAAETIADLGVYLRNNMEFATSSKPISFERELSHIEKYVSIEKMRFGERINVVYDIKEKGFEIPALSVQPLVENAIKHGISKKRKGGTVEVSTWRGASDIHVLIKDDGKGFDMSQPFSTDRVHLGLEIVGSRLERMCNGELKISSEPGVGTVCEIIIPIEF